MTVAKLGSNGPMNVASDSLKRLKHLKHLKRLYTRTTPNGQRTFASTK